MCESTEELLNIYIKQRQDAEGSGIWLGSEPLYSFLNDELKKLRKMADSCRACPLGEYRINACFGNGSSRARIMFIGEGPGYEEDHRGEVFVGRAGQLLNKIIESMLDITREEVYITNIVKCHPMKDSSDPEKRGNDRPPDEKELSACIERFLFRQIELIRPSVIVTLGAPASKTILKSSSVITSLRGRPSRMILGGFETTVIPTYHPAYLLRSPSKKREVFEDFKLIRSLL